MANQEKDIQDPAAPPEDSVEIRTEDPPDLSYESRYEKALESARKTDAEISVTIIAAAAGGGIAIAIAHYAQSNPSTITLAIVAGIGSLAGALLVAYFASRRRRR